jgi:hypothetical protein
VANVVALVAWEGEVDFVGFVRTLIRNPTIRTRQTKTFEIYVTFVKQDVFAATAIDNLERWIEGFQCSDKLSNVHITSSM